jgi:hypothetical protein
VQYRETEPNRATTSQIETTRATSQRQVASRLSRNDSKWRESRGPGRRWNRATYLISGRVAGGANMGLSESILCVAARSLTLIPVARSLDQKGWGNTSSELGCSWTTDEA